jgi:hypothetical protein
VNEETELFLAEAIEKAHDALNECIGVFTRMARKGQYPEPLMGQGWEFAIHARDALHGAAKRASLGRFATEYEEPKDDLS